MRHYSRYPLLIINEWLCLQPKKHWTLILLGMMGSRYTETSTIICTQLTGQRSSGILPWARSYSGEWRHLPIPYGWKGLICVKSILQNHRIQSSLPAISLAGLIPFIGWVVSGLMVGLRRWSHNTLSNDLMYMRIDSIDRLETTEEKLRDKIASSL